MFLCNFTRQRSGSYIAAVFACLLITLTILGGCTSSRNEKAEKVRQGITAYLQQKYGIEFEVGQPYLTGSMSTTHYQAKAHPKGKPEIEFIINDNSYMDEMGSGVYTDYYLTAKWSYQGRQELEKKLKEVYGEGVDFNISWYAFRLKNDHAFKDLDYAQIFENSHGQGTIQLSYDIFMDGTQFNTEAEAKRAYNILKHFILDYETDFCNFNVVYIDKAFKQDYQTNSKPYTDNWSILHGDIHYSAQYEKEIEGKKILGWLQVENRPSKAMVVNNDNDLIGHYK